MPATPDVFHLLLSDGAERLAHEGLPLAAAQALAPAAQEVLKADPIEFTEDQPTDRLLLHPEPSRRIAEGRMQALGVSSLVAVPQDLGPAEALRWAQASLPEGPSELLLLGEPERGISLAVQRVLSARHLVGRLPFHRVRELDDYAARLAAERRRPDALRPTLYTPRVGLGPLESAYQTLLHPILERLEEEGLSPRNASSGWTQAGDLDGLLDTPGTLLVHLDLGRGGDDPRVFGAPALGDAAAWRAKWIKQRHLWLPDGCWWLEASAGLGLPRPSGYAPLFDALGLSLPVEARATLPEAALANPNGPLAVFGPADHVPLLPPCQDADAEAIREAWIEARTELILALAQGLPVGLALFALRVEMHYALQALLPDSSTPEALGALGLAWAWVESLTLFADPAVCFTGDVSRVTEDTSAPELHVEEAVEAGSWSLILPDGDRFDARVQSLLPLVGRREAQTGQEARVLRYPAGRSDPSAWIERHVPAGLTPPPQLVLVGDAEELPFALQLALAERARVGRLPFSDPEALRPYAYKLLRAESLDAQHVSPTALVFSNGDWQGAGRKLSTRLLTLDSAGKLAPARALKPALRPKEVLKALDSNQPVVLATLTRTAFDSASPSEQRRIQGEPRLDSEHSALSAETFSGQQAALYRGAWLLVGHHGAGTPASPVYGDALAALPPDASGPVLGARSLDGRPFVSATAEAALRSESGPLVVLGHLDATFSDSLDPARTGLPVLELVLSDVMSRVLQGEPAGEAHQRFVEAARAVAEAGPGRHADTRAVARVDLGSWLLLGDPAARVPGTRGAREAARATPLDDPFDDIAPSTAPDPNADPFAASAQPPDDLTADPFAAGAQPPDDVTADPFAAPELPRDSKPHEGVVTALRFSPRGALASGGRDGRVWLAQPGAPARVIDEPDELGAVVELRFSPQGDVLLAAFADGRCRLFQVDDSAPPVTLAGDGYSLTLIGFTADGRDLITVSDHGRVVRWPERGAGEPRALPSVERVRGAALGGSILALGDEEGTLRLYDLDHGDSTQEITRAHAQALDVLGISADGRTLLSAGRQSGAAVWDLAGEKPSATHRWSTPKTMDIAGAMSADGQHVVLHFGPSGLALGRADGSLSLARGDAFGPAVNRLALLPNGALLLAHDDRSLRLWDGRGAPRSVYLEGGPLNTLAATDDGQLLAAGDADGRIVVLRARDITDPAMPPAGLVEIPPLANEPWRLLGEAGAPIRRVLAYARLRIAGTERGAVRVHDAEGALIWEGHGHGSSPVHQLAISPDADLLITASEGGRIRLTRVAPVAGWGVPLQVAGEPALALGFPSEKQAVTVTRDGRIRLHDLSQLEHDGGGLVNATPVGPNRPLRDAALSPRGALALACADGDVLHLTEPTDAAPSALPPSASPPQRVAISARGDVVLVQHEDGALRLHRRGSEEVLEHKGLGALRALAPDGRGTGFIGVTEKGQLLEVGPDGRAAVWPRLPTSLGGALAHAWSFEVDRSTVRVLAPASGGLIVRWGDTIELNRIATPSPVTDVSPANDGALLCGLADGQLVLIEPRVHNTTQVSTFVPDRLEPEVAEHRSPITEEDSDDDAQPHAEVTAEPPTASAEQPRDASESPAATHRAPPDVSPDVSPVITLAPVLLGAAPPRPPEEQVLTLRVTLDEVELEFQGQRYRSANRLQALRRHLQRAYLMDPLSFGEVLRDAVIHDTLPPGLDAEQQAAWRDRTTRVGLLQALAEGEVPRRLELLLDDAPELHEPLWEALAHDGRPLAARSELPFARRVYPGPPAPEAPEPLRLLVAVCDHPRLQEQGPEANALLSRLADIDVAAQLGDLDRGLSRLRDAGVGEVRVLNETQEPVSWEALCQALEEGYNALHLVAHGVVMAEGGFHLVMDRGPDAPPFVSADELLGAVPDSLRLVVLASCNSALHGGGAFNSLGARLAQRVPAVVAMQRPLHVESAQVFAQHFYDDLARSGDPAAALSATRQALFRYDQKRHLNDWPVPVLYRSADHGPLFPPEGERMDELGPMSDPSPDPARELEELRRTLRAAAPHLDAPRILQAVSRGQPNLPDTPPQDREALSALLTRPVELQADALREYVLSQDPPLEYSTRMYRQLCAALNARKHVVLIGPPGTGKTTLAHYVCRFTAERGACAGLVPTTATADWTTFDTIGGYVPAGGDVLSFRPGVFMRAISEGRWLVIDELNRAEIDKAIGELFTAIAGQVVELPYQVAGEPVRVRPPASRAVDAWVPQDARPYDYVIHPGWRVLATMNVYDRSSLYAMSFAFMRRFAFVEVGVPDKPIYDGLIERWSEGLPAEVPERLKALIHPQTELMRRRGMGPAILKDMLRYIEQGAAQGVDAQELCAEAFLLYGASQLDGLDLDAAGALHVELAGRFAASQALEDLLTRLRELYPAMPEAAWSRGEGG